MMQSITTSALARFLKNESLKELNSLFLYSALVGLMSTLLVALINKSAASVAAGESVTGYFFAYLAALIAFYWIAKKANRKNVTNSQRLIHRFVLRMMKRILTTDMLSFEKIGASVLLNSVARDAQTVATCIPLLISATSSLFVSAFLILYTAIMSITAFSVLLVSTIIVLIATTRTLKRSHKKMTEAYKIELKMRALLESILHGYQEVKVNRKRSSELTRDLVQTSRETVLARTSALITIVQQFTFLQASFYVLIGLMIFIVPIISADFSEDVIIVATTTLFLAGALASTINCFPAIMTANASAGQLLAINDTLGQSKDDNVSLQSEEMRATKIELKDVYFSYRSDKKIDHKSFSIGPISYTFSKGKIYFVKGANGSGKTTLIKLLLGLYIPDAGTISINDIPVTTKNRGSYRESFSVVFSNFYLFKKLYGIDAQQETIDELIKYLELDAKVSVDEKLFSELNLSTGQKKRIALVVALLEGNDFIVLDEWAADQDPVFRKKFYTVILPRLKAEGKTIIALTHDDAYFDAADHIINLDEGRVVDNAS
ncbi:cyclic peptide export ABC transporter [Burkholderiales bacterium]|nr:cyclic peptide export ABC transporter [Burkholderiales bacterium]